MSAITQLFAAMTTRDSGDSGTDSPIMLIGNVQGTDFLQYTFPDTSQNDQGQGEANIYSVEISDGLDSAMLPETYFRVAIRGDDAWRPENFFLWGTDSKFSRIIPLGMRVDVTTKSVERLVDGTAQSNDETTQVVLSTDNNEGDLSFPLSPIPLGDEAMPIRSLLMLVTTADQDDAGSDDQIDLVRHIQINATDAFPIPNLSRGQASWSFIPLFQPFVKNSLDLIRGISVQTYGDDAWLPESFFLFGLDTKEGMPTRIIPLVHIPKWTLGALSTNNGEGRSEIFLPITLP